MVDSPFPGDDDRGADENLGRALRSISPATLRAFVLLAILIQAGLFAGSLGLMLGTFRGQWALGGALAGGGLLAFALAALVYRRHRNRR